MSKLRSNRDQSGVKLPKSANVGSQQPLCWPSPILPFIEKRPAVALRVITLLCERLRQTTDMVEESMFLSLPARLAKQLLALALSSGDGASLHVDLLQSELADMIGVSREGR